MNQLREREQINEKEYNRRRRRVDPGWSPGGRQESLINVLPDGHERIVELAQQYKQAQRDRMNAGKDEVKFKKELADAIRQSDLKADKDGKYHFTIDGFTISLIPRDEVIKVVENGDDGSAAAADSGDDNLSIES